MAKAHKTVDRWMIERDIDRGVRFLPALSRQGALREAMAAYGYTDEEHQTGWALLLALLGYQAPRPAAQPVQPPLTPQSEAIAELARWNVPHFTLARAALEHLHPEQAAYLFAGLTAQRGAAAVAAVNTFVDRVAALRDGRDDARAGSREQDRAAVETLATRGIIDPSVEVHLRRCIAIATTLAPAAPAPSSDRQREAEQLRAQAQAFHAWLADWRATARVITTRRDHLIRLGLAKRRKRGKTAKRKAKAISGDE